ncbi:regulatory protein RecX [Pontixanthobacter sp.]|uniref:regulatory protein RecX n=1 Tax=Pontixanthobacter sp. TaxID=2792078 RepID=UPI003C79E1C3
MNDKRSGKKRERQPRKPPKPLNTAGLRDLALAYVARFSTSSGKLQSYLARKIRERGWAQGEPPADIAGLVARYTALGYIDDAAYAASRAGGLLRRGYGPRRVSQDLYAAGIDEHLRDDVAPGEADQREAALNLARKRRFGPFHREELDQKRRDRQIAAMLRAGHSFDIVRAVINAHSEDAAEQWACEARDDEPL